MSSKIFNMDHCNAIYTKDVARDEVPYDKLINGLLREIVKHPDLKNYLIVQSLQYVSVNRDDILNQKKIFISDHLNDEFTRRYKTYQISDEFQYFHVIHLVATRLFDIDGGDKIYDFVINIGTSGKIENMIAYNHLERTFDVIIPKYEIPVYDNKYDIKDIEIVGVTGFDPLAKNINNTMKCIIRAVTTLCLILPGFMVEILRSEGFTSDSISDMFEPYSLSDDVICMESPYKNEPYYIVLSPRLEYKVYVNVDKIRSCDVHNLVSDLKKLRSIHNDLKDDN